MRLQYRLELLWNHGYEFDAPSARVNVGGERLTLKLLETLARLLHRQTC